LNKLTPLSLKTAFDSSHLKNLHFEDLLQIDVANEYKSFQIKNKITLKPSDKLKKILQFLNTFIFNYSLINTNVVHSYRKGKNPFTAVQKHANSKYFFQTDIQKFFYSITAKDVENVINKNLGNAPISDINTYKSQLLNFAMADRQTLPVGFPTSPSISNSCLYDFDNDLEAYCLKHKIIYTRYSDDVILSSKSTNLTNIESIISNKLKHFYDGRFKLNPNKTKHTNKGRKIKLLGIVILPSGKVSVDIKVKKQLEILLHFYINDKEKFSDYLINKYKGSLLTISGQINHINTIDKSYINKLRKKYGNFIIDTFIHRTIK